MQILKRTVKNRILPRMQGRCACAFVEKRIKRDIFLYLYLENVLYVISIGYVFCISMLLLFRTPVSWKIFIFVSSLTTTGSKITYFTWSIKLYFILTHRNRIKYRWKLCRFLNHKTIVLLIIFSSTEQCIHCVILTKLRHWGP